MREINIMSHNEGELKIHNDIFQLIMVHSGH